MPRDRFGAPRPIVPDELGKRWGDRWPLEEPMLQRYALWGTRMDDENELWQLMVQQYARR